MSPETLYGAYVLGLVLCGLAFGDRVVEVLVSTADRPDDTDEDS